MINAIAKSLPAAVKSPLVFAYVSNDDAKTLDKTVAQALLKNDYEDAVPNATSVTQDGAKYFGLSGSKSGYVRLFKRSGDLQVLSTTFPVPTSAQQVAQTLGITKLDNNTAKRFLNAVKGKKSVVFVVASLTIADELAKYVK